MKNPNCYECIHREKLIGSAHSKCKHPSLLGVTEDPLFTVLALMMSARKLDIDVAAPEDLNVVVKEHGWKNGWANYPFNFDPIWIANCDGFTVQKKGESQE